MLFKISKIILQFREYMFNPHHDLSAVLSAVGKFSTDDIQQFEQKAILKHYAKGAELLSLGNVSSVFLVVSGSAYQFELDREEIEEQVIGLYAAGDWCFNHASFVSQRGSQSVIKAYSDLVVRELNVFSIHQLLAISPAFFQLGGLLERGVDRLRYFDSANSAKEKYEMLIAKNPALLQEFPLKMIASYLKIAPETMSRLRAKK